MRPLTMMLLLLFVGERVIMVLRDWMSDEIFDQKAKSCSDGGLPSLGG